MGLDLLACAARRLADERAEPQVMAERLVASMVEDDAGEDDIAVLVVRRDPSAHVVPGGLAG